MLLIEDRRYYIYIYLDPRRPGNFQYGEFCFSHEPFYVGYGHNNRLLHHLKEAKKDKNNLKLNKIRKIFNTNLFPIIFKLYKNINISEADFLEKYVIKIIGRLINNTGPLTNITEGGKGTRLVGKNNGMYGRNDQCYKPGGMLDWNKSIKGKSLEQIHGVEKAKKLKEEHSKKLKGKSTYQKGKTFEELFGDRSDNIKNKICTKEAIKKRKLVAYNKRLEIYKNILNILEKYPNKIKFFKIASKELNISERKIKEILKLFNKKLFIEIVLLNRKLFHNKWKIGKPAWNSGLTKETDNRMKNVGNKKGFILWNKGVIKGKEYANKL